MNENENTQDDIREELPEDILSELSRVERRQENGWREIKSYVLRGQRLKDFQIQALKEHFHDYALVYDENRKLDFSSIFGNDNPVVIEIGFGMGESTLKIAKANPDINYIGIEVFLYGFSKLLANVAKENLKNIRLMRFDAVQVIRDLIEDGSVSGFHIFFPDPWQKKRHHKKRLIQPSFTELLAKKLKTGGYIYCVTDWQDYAEQILEVLSNTPGMVNPYDGYATPRDWRPETSFERKGLTKNYEIHEIWVEKSREPQL